MKMKQIFTEQIEVGIAYQADVYRPIYSDRYAVHRQEAMVSLVVTAYYSKKLNVLVVDTKIERYPDDELSTVRVLETVDSEAGAIRRAVAVADEARTEAGAWCTAYDNRTDEEIVATYEATQIEHEASEQ